MALVVIFLSGQKCFDRIGRPIIREKYVGEFFMENGLLYWKHQDGTSYNQLFVLKELAQDMFMNHESAFSDHLRGKDDTS